MISPVALVLDDVHVLRNRECRAALSVLADHVPDGSPLALAGRAEPPLRIARLRAEGRILEIGTGDLSLTAEETSSLLRGAGLTLGDDDVAALHRLGPGLIPVLRRRAARWCLRNGLPEEALEYFMAAGDAGTVARLVEKLAVPAHRLGRVTTVQRWFQWLEDRGGMEGHPMAAVLASLLSAFTARPVEAERWADAVDRWHYGDTTRPDDPSVEAWAALLRAILCRRGAAQMRADADEAVRRFAAVSFVTPTPALTQGLARVLSGDLDSGDATLADAVSVGEKAGAPDDLAIALCERASAVFADLCAPAPRGSGPDRADSRPHRARRTSRCQDAHAGGG